MKLDRHILTTVIFSSVLKHYVKLKEVQLKKTFIDIDILFNDFNYHNNVAFE